MRQLFELGGGQSFGASTSAAVLPMNIQGWFPLGLTLLAVQESSPAPGGLRLSLILYSWINLLYPPGKLINSELLFSSVQSLSHVRLFVTPWTVARQAPLSMGFSRQEYWSELPFPSPGDLLNSGTEPRSPDLQADSVPSEPPRKPLKSFFLE